MLRQRILFILLIAMLFASCTVQSQGPGPVSKEKQLFRCTIWADQPLLLKGRTAVVHVSLENTSSQDIVVTGMTGHLRAKPRSDVSVWDKREEVYWSPVDVRKKSALKPVRGAKGGWTYPETSLTLRAQNELEFTLDLSALKWANEISAGLPSQGHLSAVRDGSYELHFNLGARDAIDGVKCNKIDVEIQTEHDQRH